MAFVEDRQLLELSVSPKKSLFPLLNRAEAMSPLIALLALLPPLYVLMNRTLTPLDALWGLKAVAITTAESAEGWLDPKAINGAVEAPLKWQPPLSSWLRAGVMSVTGTDHPLALVLTSYLATAGLIALLFGFSDQLRGPQFAWWTTLLTSLSGPILEGAQTPAPVSLTLSFAVAACWGFAVHCEKSKRLYSWPLGGAGLAWGLCLLAGGPVSLVVLAILLLYVLVERPEPKPSLKVEGNALKKTWKARLALRSLGILCLLGFIVGGWWEVWMFARHGGTFLSGWLVGSASLPTPETTSAWSRQILTDLSQMCGALTGLMFLGIGAGLWLLRHPAAKAERRSLVLMLAWGILAGIVWLSLRAGPHRSDAFTVVWRGFCLVPATMLAALAIEQVGVRRLGYLSVLVALAVTVCVLAAVPVEVGFGMAGSKSHPLWSSVLPVLRGFSPPEIHPLLSLLWKLLFVFSVGGAGGLFLWRFLQASDVRLRIFFGAAIGVLIAWHGLIGFFGVRESTPDDQALSTLRSELAQQTEVARWTIVASDRSPLMLKYVLTSLWPHAQSLEVDSWWDERLTKDLAQNQPRAGKDFVVDWNDRDTRAPTLRVTDQAGDLHVIEFTPVGTPQVLWNHRLRVYRLEPPALHEPSDGSPQSQRG